MVSLAVKRQIIPNIRKAEPSIWSGEAAAFCPQCKALQTIYIDDDRLVPTRKFFQEGNHIYHDCGSSQPCRLYVNW